MPRPATPRPRRTLTGLDLPAYITPETAAILRDPERLARLRATRTQEGLAKELKVSREVLRRILGIYGLRGHRGQWTRVVHPAAGCTRDAVRLAAWRAYRRLDRCPPDCPHERGCAWDDCRLDQEIEGREEDGPNI